MYIKIDSNLYEKIKDITMTDYEIEGEYLPVDSVIPMLQDLLYEIENKEEKIEDLKKDMVDNYRPLTNSELIGDVERW